MNALTSYRNPIISGFCPNPSCICVDDTYYLVSSSYIYWPSIPIYVSTDLITWTQAGNVVTRTSQFDLKACKLRPGGEGETYPGGLWGPTIRHHAGVFYITVTAVYGQRPLGDPARWKNLLFTSTDPVGGEWSEPVELQYVGIDVSLFFDESGAVYAQGALVSAVKAEIQQVQLDVKTGESVSGPPTRLQSISDGTLKSPHLFKKDQWYYLLYAEGKSFSTLSTSLSRSPTPHGPFSRCPHNPLLSSPLSSPLRPTGCADLFCTPAGTWFAVCQSVRTGEGALLGQETSLVPMEWRRGDWPRALGGVALRMRASLSLSPLPPPTPTPTPAPVVRTTDILALLASSFPSFPPSLLTIRSPRSKPTFRLSPTPSTGTLTLHSDRTPLPDPSSSPCVLLRRLTSPRSTTTLTLRPPLPHGRTICETGLVLYLSHCTHVALACTTSLAARDMAYVRLRTVHPTAAAASITPPVKVDVPFTLKVESCPSSASSSEEEEGGGGGGGGGGGYTGTYDFYARYLENWVLVGKVDGSVLSGSAAGAGAGREGNEGPGPAAAAAAAGVWTGACVGVYAISVYAAEVEVREWVVEEHVVG